MLRLEVSILKYLKQKARSFGAGALILGIILGIISTLPYLTVPYRTLLYLVTLLILPRHPKKKLKKK